MATSFAHNFSIGIEILSQPCAFLLFRFFMTAWIESTDIWISDKEEEVRAEKGGGCYQCQVDDIGGQNSC